MTGRSRLKIRSIPSLSTEATCAFGAPGVAGELAAEAADREGRSGGGGEHDGRRPGHDHTPPAGAVDHRGVRDNGAGASIAGGGGSAILGGRLQRVVQAAGALAPEIFGTGRSVRSGEACGSDFLGRPLGLVVLASTAERDQLVVRADPIPEPNDVLGRVLTALFGLRDFPLHPVADPLQVFLLLAGPGCPD